MAIYWVSQLLDPLPPPPAPQECGVGGWGGLAAATGQQQRFNYWSQWKALFLFLIIFFWVGVCGLASVEENEIKRKLLKAV